MMRCRSLLLLLAISLVSLPSCSIPRAPGDPLEKLPLDQRTLHAVAFPTEPGQHSLGDWIYQYDVLGRGTRSERRIGVLALEGFVEEGTHGEIRTTPLGTFLYLEGWWNSGWLNTLTYDRPVFGVAGELTAEARTAAENRPTPDPAAGEPESEG